MINVTEKANVIWASSFDPEKSPEFKFQTGITVLDFSGGEKLSSKNKELVMPARALLMDPAGHLFVQTELDDEETVDEYIMVLEQGKDERGGGGYGGGYGGEGGGYGGEGGRGGEF